MKLGVLQTDTCLLNGLRNILPDKKKSGSNWMSIEAVLTKCNTPNKIKAL